MTLSESLLPKLSEWHPAGAGRHSLSATAPDAGWAAHLTADKADTLSCLVWELALARTGVAPAEMTLRAWAEGVAARATGLLEPLKLLEVDEARGEALLRSTAPAKRGEHVAYYEVRLTGLDRATVRRFTALSPRSEVAQQATRGAGENGPRSEVAQQATRGAGEKVTRSGREQVAFALTHEVLAKLAGDIAG